MTPLAGLAESAAPDSANAAVIETLGAAIVLVVPGYVLGRVVGRDGREPDATDRGMAVRLAADSILVHTAMMPLTFLLADSVLRHGAAGYGAQIFCWLVAVCLVVPAGLGGCALWLLRRDPGTAAGRIAGVLGLTRSNRLVHAWSAMLAELPQDPEGCMARVILRDGREVSGYYTGWARASDDPARHDLYIAEAYRSRPVSALYPISGGIWLNGDDIVSVEFFLARERPRPSKEKTVNEERKPDEAPEAEQPRVRARRGSGEPVREPASGPEPASTPEKAPVPEQPTPAPEEAGR